MKMYYRIFTILLILSTPLWCSAEVIYLKDGTKIEAAKVWEDNGFIKFSPKGYEGVVITYDKDIVDRIGEKKIAKPQKPAPKAPEAVESQAAEPPPKAPSTAGDAPQIVTKPPAAPIQAEPPPAVPQTEPAKTAAPANTKPPDPPVSQAPKSGLRQPPPAGGVANPSPTQKPAAGVSGENQPYAEYDGIQFYDPRRTYKYRTGPESWHRTLQDAIDALALTFESSPDWIEQNIGNTNDLGQIYRNLQRSKARPVGTGLAAGSQVDGTPFYDPRRQYKYWVSETARHRNLEDALEDLARQYGRSPDWIQKNIGDTNDLGQIHRNLEQRKMEEDRLQKKMN